MGKSDSTYLGELNEDKEGLIKQADEIRAQITELNKRLIMVKGALQYVNQKLDSHKGG